ncbi:MAG: hypothetical protein ACFFCV_03050 [Promethearchaeota archaeon]
MFVDSQSIEKKVEELLDHILKHGSSFDRKEFQRGKFSLLSKLVTELFKSKNSRISFNNISSLIILILNICNEKFGLDNYPRGDNNSLKTFNPRYKHILKDEFL